MDLNEARERAEKITQRLFRSNDETPIVNLQQNREVHYRDGWKPPLMNWDEVMSRVIEGLMAE